MVIWCRIGGSQVLVGGRGSKVSVGGWWQPHVCRGATKFSGWNPENYFMNIVLSFLKISTHHSWAFRIEEYFLWNIFWYKLFSQHLWWRGRTLVSLSNSLHDGCKKWIHKDLEGNGRTVATLVWENKTANSQIRMANCLYKVWPGYHRSANPWQGFPKWQPPFDEAG